MRRFVHYYLPVAAIILGTMIAMDNIADAQSNDPPLQSYHSCNVTHEACVTVF